MKKLQKISVLLAAAITTDLHFLHAAPTRTNANRPSGTTSRSTGNHAAGLGAKKHSQPEANPLAVGTAAVSHRNSESSQDSSTAPATTTPPVASPTANVTPQLASALQAQTENTQVPAAPAAIPTSDAPTNTANGSRLQQKLAEKNSSVTNAGSSQQTQNIQNPAEVNNEENQKKAAEEKQAAQDIATIPVDKDEILEQLKTINTQDKKDELLLDMDSMNQLFSNFVYFKDFIVKNFEKDKMLHLAKEFIQQLYPKEHIPTISLESSKSKTPDNATPTTQTPDITDNDATNVSGAHEQDDNTQNDVSEQAPAADVANPEESPVDENGQPTEEYDQAAYEEYLAAQYAEQNSQAGIDDENQFE